MSRRTPAGARPTWRTPDSVSCYSLNDVMTLARHKKSVLRSDGSDHLTDEPTGAIKAGEGRLVGRGGVEPPTSRLSGVRSNHLSYRPGSEYSGQAGQTGGAYRDRTDDLLNAIQSLSQLS